MQQLGELGIAHNQRQTLVELDAAVGSLRSLPRLPQANTGAAAVLVDEFYANQLQRPGPIRAAPPSNSQTKVKVQAASWGDYRLDLVELLANRALGDFHIVPVLEIHPELRGGAGRN